MNKSLVMILSLMTLSSCGGPLRTEKAIMNAYWKASEQYKKVVANFELAFDILDEPVISTRDQQLKTIILRKNKEWKACHYSMEEWMVTGLNEFESFPFITYNRRVRESKHKLLDCQKNLRRIPFPTSAQELLMDDIKEAVLQLEALSEVVSEQDRYLQEKDKHESIMLTRSKDASILGSLFEPKKSCPGNACRKRSLAIEERQTRIYYADPLQKVTTVRVDVWEC